LNNIAFPKLHPMKSQKNLVCILLSFLLIVVVWPMMAQDKQVELKKGVLVSDILKKDPKHRYTVKLEANQYAYFILVQHGIDAMITTYDPDGNKLEEFDSPNFRNGDEPVTLITGKSGNYILEVSSIDTKEQQGKYDISWLILEPKATTPEKQIDQLFNLWNNLESPGAVVAVAKDGKIIFEKGYGSAEPEYNIPITPSTVFHIASVSKQFTAFAILLLEKDGKLSINDDIRKYIPEVPDFGKVITLNHLLHHTSGLRDQWELLAMAGWRLDDNISTEQILRLVSRQKELNFNPGDQMMYSNTGFTLLAEVVARVSGMSFADYTRTHIFEPLKMTHTFFYDDCEKLVKNRAYSFYVDSTGYKKSNLNYSTAGATSLFTTAPDLCIWSMNFEKPIVGKEIMDKMAERGVLNNGDTIDYAMGQSVGVYKGLKFFGHGGADAGYRTQLFRIPGEHFSVNVLSNFASFNPWSMALKIIDIYLNDKEVIEPPKPAAPKTDAGTVEVDPAILAAYCGQYELEPGHIASITLEGSTLFAEAPQLPKTVMTPVSESEFIVEPVQARVNFRKDENGKVSGILVNMQGQSITARRLPDFDPSAVNLTELTGDFYSPELNTTYTFVVESGNLIARHFRTGDVTLKPSKTDIFSGNQWYFNQVEFIRGGNNLITGCKVGNGRVRNLKFDKVTP
jgi:CubicO group peptidase (beta-lactamase class C family)